MAEVTLDRGRRVELYLADKDLTDGMKARMSATFPKAFNTGMFQVRCMPSTCRPEPCMCFRHNSSASPDVVASFSRSRLPCIGRSLDFPSVMVAQEDHAVETFVGPSSLQSGLPADTTSPALQLEGNDDPKAVMDSHISDMGYIMKER